MNNFKIDGLKRFLLLYASQTGQAQAIAEEIAAAAPAHGLKASLHCLSLTDKRFCIENESCAVFVVSTTGDGEPPDSAAKFYRRINGNTLKRNYLEKLNFTLLGLGDSNYIKFCLSARLLEQRLKALSANSFYPTGFGDDAFGIETGVDPWIENLWPALQKQLFVETVTTNAYYLSQTDTKDISLIVTTQASNESTMDAFKNLERESTTIGDLNLCLKDFDVSLFRVRKMPVSNLEVSYENSCDNRVEFTPSDNILHSSASPISKVKLVEARLLSSSEDVKRALELTLKFEGPNVPYLPGDSFGFVCPNSEEEVQMLLERLNVLHLSEVPITLHLPDERTGKVKLPTHIPSSLALKDVFLYCVEIRVVPKKILLRILAETASEEEKKSLLFLSSPEGSKVYTNCIRIPSLSILDVLLQYKSCKPTVETLLEYLPPLKPRFYSVASSPLNDSLCFKIVFNVLQFQKACGRKYDREGVCTGWLNRQSTAFIKSTKDELQAVTDKMTILDIKCTKFPLLVYKRQNIYFHLPDSLSCPLIMIGPGTGVAPFIGFLQHREKLLERNSTEKEVGETWLFYGCRYNQKDFLYKTELERLNSSGILTHLIVSFSREPKLTSGITTRYVHESIRQYSKALFAAVEARGRIYVCGDAKHMAQDVQQAFIESFEENLGCSQIEAKTYVEKLQADHRYLNDIWA